MANGDQVTLEADAEVGNWSRSLVSVTEALKPDACTVRVASEIIRIRVELTAIRQALQKIAKK